MLTWSIVAALKLSSSCAAAAVPPAASMARLRTRSRRLSEPRSKRPTRVEMIDSMSASLARTLDFGTKMHFGTEDLAPKTGHPRLGTQDWAPKTGHPRLGTQDWAPKTGHPRLGTQDLAPKTW